VKNAYQENDMMEQTYGLGVLASLSAMPVLCCPALFELKLRECNKSTRWKECIKRDILGYDENGKNASVADLQTLRNQNYLWSILILPRVIF
jgi:hypothetical protein